MINFKGLEGLVFVQRGKNPIYVYIYIIPSLAQHSYASFRVLFLVH